MKTISILKNLINVYYYMVLLVFITSVFTFLGSFFTQNTEMVSEVLEMSIDLNQINFHERMIVLGVILVVYFMYTRAVFLLKSSLGDLASGNYFSGLVINNFNKVGKLFLISCLIEFTGIFVLRFVMKKKIGIESESSVFLFLIMGLFFLFLSQVFARTGSIKQENELTI